MHGGTEFMLKSTNILKFSLVPGMVTSTPVGLAKDQGFWKLRAPLRLECLPFFFDRGHMQSMRTSWTIHNR